MTPQDLEQIDELLQKRLNEQSDDLQQKMGELGKRILEAMDVSTVSKREFEVLGDRVNRLEEEIHTS